MRGPSTQVRVAPRLEAPPPPAAPLQRSASSTNASSDKLRLLAAQQVAILKSTANNR